MKTTIKIVVIYFALLQLLVPLFMMIPCAIYLHMNGMEVTSENLGSLILVPGQLMGMLLMMLYLWKNGYLHWERATWSPVSPAYLALTVIIGLSAIWLLEVLMSHLSFLPNLLEQQFDILQSSWLGILCIALLAPIFEEILFRGIITKSLLQEYRPGSAIVLSALIFGVVHLNPVQVVSACIIGLLLGWMYYKTASLIPCIAIHIINNSLSVYLTLKYPDMSTINELIGDQTLHLALTVLVGVLFVGAYLLMRRTTIAYPWRKKEIKLEA